MLDPGLLVQEFVRAVEKRWPKTTKPKELITIYELAKVWLETDYAPRFERNSFGGFAVADSTINRGQSISNRAFSRNPKGVGRVQVKNDRAFESGGSY
jgi:hypothetical protein